MLKKFLKIILNAILVLLVLLGIFVVFSFVPFSKNYKLFTVMSGSMSPAIHTGSLIFVKSIDSYGVDDIVTRQTNDPKTTVTHRIVEKREESGEVIFQTKGDANQSPDMESVNQKDIIGKVFLTVSLIGYPVGYAKTTPGIILLIVVPAVIIISDEMKKIKKEIEKKIDYRKRIKKREENNLSEEKNEDTPEKI